MKPQEYSYRGDAVVAFLDILGYSQFVESNWDEQADFAVSLTRHVKDHYTGRSLVEDDHQLYGPHVEMISDAVLVCSPMDGEELFLSIEVLTTLGTAALLWLELLSKGLTLRGGIEYGSAHWDDAVTTGPALVHAHKLEAGIANWSRIVLGPRFIDLCRRKLLNWWSIAYRPVMLDWIAEDFDGLLILDPKAMTDDRTLKYDLDLGDQGATDHVLDLMNRHPRYRSKYDPLYRQLTREGIGIAPERFVELADGYGRRFGW